MTQWADFLAIEPTKNQPSFNAILKNSTATSVRQQALPIEKFQSGKYYWGNEAGITRDQAFVAHNNWITKHDRKKQRFIDAGLWLVKDD